MKYVLAGLAAIAAAVALFFRPPTIGPAVVPPAGTPTPDVAAARIPANLVPHDRAIVVYIAGEVRKPGVYAFGANLRAVDALARAGGPLPDADLVTVNLAAPLNDGDEIAVPKIGAPSRAGRAPRTRSGHPRTAHRHRTPGHRRKQPAEPAASADAPPSFDLNAADQATLQEVPGIGPGLAGRIVAYRTLNGPFASIDELADVSGITPRLQDALAALAFIR